MMVIPPAHAASICPACGKALSEIHVLVEEEVPLTIRERFQTKVRHGQPSEVAPHHETTAGDDLQWSTGRWLHVERRIGRENDLYTETLTDPETGEVVREVHERLSEHRGRGAAKQGDTPKNGENPTS